MIADDIHELYMLLRGSRSARPVLDARALFLDKKASLAYEKLVDARDSYSESRTRLLRQDTEQQFDSKDKDANRQRQKLVRKQEKALAVLKAFDELLPAIERLVNRERSQEPAERPVSIQQQQSDVSEQQQTPEPKSDPVFAETSITVLSPSDISEAFVQSYCAAEGDAILDVIDQAFGFCEVKSDNDIYPNAVYFIRTSKRYFLVHTPEDQQATETVSLVSVVDEKPVRSFEREDFLRLGTRRKMVLLTKSTTAQPEPALSEDDSEGGPSDPVVIDMGAFSQLLSAAQRCGLVPGADRIAHVRDREFRRGNYDLAFQAIDAMFSQFSASANQRTQRLVREDADISSGRIKISPKELQAKRVRDRAQTQEIDRAQRRFQIVLEGLRRLMRA